jgi:hypothetical protein
MHSAVRRYGVEGKSGVAWERILGGHETAHRIGAAKFSVDSEQGLVVVRFGKTVTTGVIEHYAAQLLAHPSFRPCFSEIADLTHVQKLDLQAEEFLRLANKLDPFSYEAKRAFVARTSVQAHAARVHKILRTQSCFEISHTFEEAQRWIRFGTPGVPCSDQLGANPPQKPLLL